MARILVIEDEPQILTDMLYLLQEAQYDVEGVMNGAEGLAQAQKFMPDLIICDIMLPDMNGYKILEELRSRPETAGIPLLFVTALGSREDIRRGMNLGADDYLVKPFQPTELLSAIQSRIARQESITAETRRLLDEMRGNLTMALPHEFRTPLMSILGYSELLLDDEHPTEPHELRPIVETIHRSGTRLSHLVENYLLLGQLELGKGQFNPETLAQKVGVNTSARIVNTELRQAAQRYHREADAQAQVRGATACISEIHLHKIMAELLDNAFKFSEAKSPVKVSTRTADGYWQIVIQDHGRGMSARQVKQLGAYVQFNRSLYEQQGMGLGLTVARRLLELYGGGTTIESQLDQGTTVHIQIPLAAANT
jgi:signal transduction histidine kinase